MTKIEWRLVNRKLHDLDPHPSNPRKLSVEQHKQLTESLTKFGIAEKPIVNKNNKIIGGHQRIKIMKEMGIKDIECWIPSRVLSPKEVDELNVRLNKNTGSFDYDILANEFEALDLIEWGFTEDQLVGEITQIPPELEEEEKKKKCKMCPACGHEF